MHRGSTWRLCSLLACIQACGVCAQDERDGLSEALAACRAQLASLREAHERGLLEVQAVAKTQAAEAHEERAREKAALKDMHERCGPSFWTHAERMLHAACWWGPCAY